MESKKFARISEFNEPVYCTFLDYQRVDGETIGSRFVDKWGKTNVLKFSEVGDDTERTLENSSYTFHRDFKSSGLKSGDRMIVVSVQFPHPENSEITYRRWIFQKVSEVSTSAPETAEASTSSLTGEVDVETLTGNGDARDTTDD